MALVCITVLGGCRRDVQNKEAVRKGVMTYLATRSDLLAMDVSVAAVSFRQNEATATVHFQAKGSAEPGAGMSINYILERKGSDWVVKGRSGAGAAHGSQGMPQAPPQGGSLGAMPETLPPNQARPSLPPGHPPIGSSQTPGSNK